MLPHIPAVEEALDEDASRGPSAPLAEAEAAWIAFEHNAPEASVAREGSASLLPRGQGSGVANGAAHLAGAFTGDGDDDAGLAELLARAAANVEMAHECCNPHDTIRKVAAEGRRRGSHIFSEPRGPLGFGPAIRYPLSALAARRGLRLRRYSPPTYCAIARSPPWARGYHNHRSPVPALGTIATALSTHA